LIQQRADSFNVLTMAAEGKNIARQEELTPFEQFIQKFTSGLYGVLYILCKEVESNSFVVLGGMLVDFLQLTSFPFYIGLSVPFPWNEDLIGGWATINNAVRIYGFFDKITNVSRYLFYIFVGIVSLALVNAGVVGLEFASGRFKYFFLLKTLRSLAGLFVGISLHSYRCHFYNSDQLY